MTIGQPQAEPQDRLSKGLRAASFWDCAFAAMSRERPDPAEADPATRTLRAQTFLALTLLR
jgi:hypothetical protein